MNLQDLEMAEQKWTKTEKVGLERPTKSKGWKTQDLENDGPG